ncbi:PBSX family phage terminase large subunit [Paenibacillus alvei]|uniref:PBSX family phage terminase large subunit n=1 Tax=Paenibacillus alvei TaxID=44250 RepID=UPI00227E10E5|nr:PBSX family phage terminase large subunit [Paenibacillus alvei]
MIENVINIHEIIGKGYNRFWHNKQFYRVVKGSRGSKKSKTTALNFVYRMMKHPWANLLVIRRYSNTLRQSVYTDLKWAINRLGVASLWRTNDSLPELTYIPTGQKIIFRGLDDPLKLTSITVDVGSLCWAWFEEAYEIESEDKFRTVVESIRGSFPDPDYFKQITITFNPWSERHWLKRVFFDEKTREDDCFAITTTFRCNEWLDDGDRARYESLYRTNPRRARIVCDGDWGVADGLVYDRFRVAEFDRLDVLKRATAVTNGLDFGYTHDPTAFVSVAVDEPNKRIYIMDELYKRGMSNKAIYDELSRMGYSKSPIIADSAEPKSIDELKALGLQRIKGAAKGKDSIMHGIQFIQGYEIVIDPRCVNFITEINNYTWSKDKDGNTINRPIDEFNHILDALRYAMEAVQKSKRLRTLSAGALGL